MLLCSNISRLCYRNSGNFAVVVGHMVGLVETIRANRSRTSMENNSCQEKE